MLKIPWTREESRKSLIERVTRRMTLEARARKQKLTYFGRVMRKEGSLESMFWLSAKEEGEEEDKKVGVRNVFKHSL